jgi:hypothetical protein
MILLIRCNIVEEVLSFRIVKTACCLMLQTSVMETWSLFVGPVPIRDFLIKGPYLVLIFRHWCLFPKCVLTIFFFFNFCTSIFSLFSPYFPYGPYFLSFGEKVGPT